VVFEDSDDIKSDGSILMEDRWVNTLREDGSNFLIDNHIFVKLHASSSSDEKLISFCEHRHGTN
jgi:hypothetical protein